MSAMLVKVVEVGSQQRFAHESELDGVFHECTRTYPAQTKLQLPLALPLYLSTPSLYETHSLLRPLLQNLSLSLKLSH